MGRWKEGDRVAVVHRDPCGHCKRCTEDLEPQCENALTMYGTTVDGGLKNFGRQFSNYFEQKKKDTHSL